MSFEEYDLINEFHLNSGNAMNSIIEPEEMKGCVIQTGSNTKELL